MALISRSPSARTFAAAWSSEFSKAVKTAAGRDGRLSVSEAKRLERPFADNAANYFEATGKKTVSVAVLGASGAAYAERAARTAAGADGRLSAADAAKLPADLRADFQYLRGTEPASGGDTLTALKAKLDPLLAGLIMPSETDASVVFLSGGKLPAGPITEATVRAQLGAQHDAQLGQVMSLVGEPGDYALATRQPVEERDALEFLNRYATIDDPHDAVFAENARRFGKLRDTLTTELTDLKVFRFGEIEISTLVVGRTKSGELAALLTGQVET